VTTASAAALNDADTPRANTAGIDPPVDIRTWWGLGAMGRASYGRAW
jgi:hypothetical protein